MHTYTWRGRALAASAALAVAITPLAATGAFAAPSRSAATAVDTTYLSDTLGLPADTVVETVTYDRFQWLLQQSGQFAYIIGSASDPGFAAKVVAADTAAKAAGATKLYWYDPNLSGYTGIRNLDTRNPAGINLAAASQTVYGNTWKNVLGQNLGNGIKSIPAASGTTVTVSADDTVVNDSVDPLWDYRSTSTAAVSTTDDVFFVYDKDHAVASAPDKVVDWVNLSTTADAPGEIAAAFTAIGGGATIDQISQFEWWKSAANKKHDQSFADDARYGGDPVTDSDNADGWRIKQITYPELIHLLSVKATADTNFALLFGGTWCHNTRAVLSAVNAEAQANDVATVYNFDLVLDGGNINGTNGSGNALHARDNANSGAIFNFRPSYLYGDVVRTYFKNLVTEYDPNTGTRVSYYPGGDLTAFPDVVRKLQVPFLINYQRGIGTNPSSTAVKRQWIQQNTDASTGLPTFKEYMTEVWFSRPSAQLGLNFAIPADESTLTAPQTAALAQARAGVEFAQDGLEKLGDFFGGLPGAVVSTRTVTAPDVVYGSDATVTVAIANKYGRVPAGVATLTINGTDYPVTVNQNAAAFTVPGLAAGTYPFTVAYAGDSQVVAFTETGSLTVTPAAVAVAGTVASASTPQVAGTYQVTVTQPSGLAVPTGAVTVTLTSGAVIKTASGTLSAGHAAVVLPKLPAGTWTAFVAYAGDSNYAAKTVGGASVVSTKTAVSSVVGKVTKVPTHSKSGSYRITVVQPAGLAKASGLVSLRIVHGSTVKRVSGTISGGVVTVTVPKLSKGTWKVSVSYGGDANYVAKTVSGPSIKVTK